MASTETSMRVGIVQRGYEAFQNGDMETLRTLLAKDIIWHAPGFGPGSGDFHGIDNVIGEFGRQFQESGGTLRVEVNEVMEGEHSVVALARVGASRGDKTLDQPYAHVFHFRGDQVSEAWVVNYDQAKAAEFWS